MVFLSGILYNDSVHLCAHVTGEVEGALKQQVEQVANKTSKRKYALLAVLLLAFASILAIAGKSGTASESLPSLTDFQLMIDGTYYGDFARVDIIERDEQYLHVRLERNFISQRSLSFWAREHYLHLHEIQDIELVQNSSGNESRFLLQHCRPLSWSVNIANSTHNGYHETIDIAVQEIHSL